MGKVTIRGEAVRQKAIEILRNGGSLDDAARETGFNRNYVRQLGAKEGIRFPRHKYGHRKSKYDLKNIVQLFDEGKTPKEIQQLLSIKSMTTVYKTLRLAGRSCIKKKTVAYVMRICKNCNTAFLVHPNHNKLFCSQKCQVAYYHSKNDYKRRVMKNLATVDTSITLKKVALLNGNKCWLCGGIVDWNDYHINQDGKKVVHKMYPSVDHVIALSQGGSHSWDNVRLAHCGCNSRKGVKAIG